MSTNQNLIIVFLVAIVAIVGLSALILSVQSPHFVHNNPIIKQQIVAKQSLNNSPLRPILSAKFSFQQKVLHDSLNNSVPMYIFSGSQDLYEPIVFSMGLYGDHTVDGFTSLKEYGTHKIGAGAYPLSVLPAWANSPLSSDTEEYTLNNEFKAFLVEEKILNADFTLKNSAKGSLLFFMGNTVADPTFIIHESSHALYNNIPDYEFSANIIYDSLNDTTKTCIKNFLKFQQYNIENTHVLKDEFTAYLTEEGIPGCIKLTFDINNEGVISSQEKYFIETVQLIS